MRHFGDWRDVAAKELTAIFMEFLAPALPAVADARQAGDEAGAVAIARRALEAAVPIATAEGVVRAREAMAPASNALTFRENKVKALTNCLQQR